MASKPTAETLTTVELVHSAILRDAADLANAEVANRFVLPNPRRAPGTTRFDPRNRQPRFSGMVFRPDPVRSRKGGLSLSIEEAVMINMTDQEKAELKSIGRDAIHKAIKRNKRAFIGLILGKARKGENYFDRYKSGTTIDD